MRELDWRLLPGEHWAVTGPNGAGKSTFIRLLRGEVRPDQADGGACFWAFSGKADPSVLAVRPVARLVSAEMHHMYVKRAWRITGLELVLSGFSDALLASPRDAASRACHDAAVAVARALEAEALLPLELAALSQGQLRLLLLARALAPAPRLLLLDEPFDGLDSAARGALHTAMARAAWTAAIVCSAHREYDLPSCLTHHLRLDRGKAVYCGRFSHAADDGCVRKKTWFTDRAEPAATAPAPLPVHPGRRQAPAGVRYALELINADIYVNRVKVLRGVTWRVRPGENWRISGSNGSGKSALLRCVAGLEHVAAGGMYRRFGVEHPRLAAVRRDTGYLSDQMHAAYAYDLTGYELVCSGFDGSIGLWRPLRAAERKLAREWIRFLDLQDIADLPVSRLSSGQARRFFLARALAGSPRLLLLDEPCSSLDSASRAQFLETLGRVLAGGVQCLYVSHHDADVPEGITHELRLDKGRVMYAGPCLP